jgi:hypothetical protein
VVYRSATLDFGGSRRWEEKAALMAVDRGNEN